MTAPIGQWRLENAAWLGAAPALSLLIPFRGDDPCRLITLAGASGLCLEIIVLDDASGDEALALGVAAAIEDAAAPALMLRLAANVGRAGARNRLAAQARGRHLLFVDADMRPDGEDFFARWLEIARRLDPAVAFGGFTLDGTPRRPEHAVHRALALAGDCAPLARRILAPEKHVFTSNLLVRREVFAGEPFDEAFAGWGWEDVEWAMRASRRHPISHVENTASHLGLETVRQIAGKFEQSVGNFARVAALHGDILRGYRCFRAARLIARLPLRRHWRAVLKAIALCDRLPARPRAAALRLWRAALYAEVV